MFLLDGLCDSCGQPAWSVRTVWSCLVNEHLLTKFSKIAYIVKKYSLRFKI
jgi:hypothetical protein